MCKKYISSIFLFKPTELHFSVIFARHQREACRIQALKLLINSQGLLHCILPPTWKLIYLKNIFYAISRWCLGEGVVYSDFFVQKILALYIFSARVHYFFLPFCRTLKRSLPDLSPRSPDQQLSALPLCSCR